MALLAKQPAPRRGHHRRCGWSSQGALALGGRTSRFESKSQTSAAVLPDVMANSIGVRAAGPPG
jgi:hypothetical protein